MRVTLLKILNVLVFRGLGSASSVLLVMLVARYAPAGEAARFFLLFNLMTILAVCFRWGTDEIVLRQVAVADAGMRQSTVAGMLAFCHRRVGLLALSFLLVLPVLLFLDKHFDLYNLSLAECAWVSVASVFVALAAGVGRVLQGMGRVNLSIFLLNIAVPTFACVWVIALSVAGVEINKQMLISAIAYAAVLLYAYFVTWTRRGLGVSLWSELKSKADFSAERKAANRLGFVVLAQQSLIWGSSLIVPAMFSDSTYAIFVVSQKVSMLISFVMLAVNFTFSSRMAYLHAGGNVKALSSLVVKAGSVVFAASLGMSVLVLLFGDEIVRFSNLVAPEAFLLLSILVVSQIFNALSAFFSVVLSMAKEESLLMKVQLVGNALGLLAFFGLSLLGDVRIAALAFVLTYMLIAAVLFLKVRAVVALKHAG